MKETFEYETTIHGGIVSVYLTVESGEDEGGKYTKTYFQSVYHDGTDVTGILSNEQIAELEMEAERGFYECEVEK